MSVEEADPNISACRQTDSAATPGGRRSRPTQTRAQAPVFDIAQTDRVVWDKDGV